MNRKEFLAWGTITFPLTWAGKTAEKLRPPRPVRPHVGGLPLLLSHHPREVKNDR